MANGLNIFSPVPVVFFFFFFQCWLDSFADLTGFLSPNFKLMFQAWFVCLTRTLTSTTSHLYHITDHSTSRTQPTQHKAKALLEMWTKQDAGWKTTRVPAISRYGDISQNFRFSTSASTKPKIGKRYEKKEKRLRCQNAEFWDGEKAEFWDGMRSGGVWPQKAEKLRQKRRGRQLCCALPWEGGPNFTTCVVTMYKENWKTKKKLKQKLTT